MDPMPSNVVSNANTDTEHHSLINMLERWVVLGNFEWKTSDPSLDSVYRITDFDSGVTNEIKSYSFPQAILEKSSLHRQKLNNFFLFKSDIEFEVKVNATPFHQGALIISYHPRNLDLSNFRKLTVNHLAGISSFPHRILYLEKENTVKMRIPFAHIKDMIDLGGLDDNFGDVKIHVLVPLTDSASSTRCGITLRGRFVNPIPQTPTNSSLLTSTRYAALELEGLKKVLPTRHPVLNLAAQDGEGESTGPVTKICDTVSNVSSSLSDVPIIGKFASGISWASRLAKGVSSVLGFSKPEELNTPQIVTNKTGLYMGNVEGKDHSRVLAQIPDNCVDSRSFNPTKIDEMSHAAIVSRPNIVKRFTTGTSHMTDRLKLFSWPVTPFVYEPTSTGETFSLGSISYLAALHKYWRGELQYFLTCVKTQYHSGRIVVIYFPGLTEEELPERYEETLSTNYNAIYDLRADDDSELSLTNPFVIPYAAAEPWKRVFEVQNGKTFSKQKAFTTGSVGVYTLNNLVAPDTVDDNVSWVLSMRGGPDLEFAIPQIRIASGWRPVAKPENIQAWFITEWNETVDGREVFCDPDTATDHDPALYSADSTLVYSSAKFWDIVGRTSTEKNLTDYEFEIVWDGSPYYSDKKNTIGISTDVSGKVTDCYLAGGDFHPSTAIPNFTNFNLHASAPVSRRGPLLVAQDGMSDATNGSDPLESKATMLDSSPTYNISHSTTGEYCRSLRPLLRRFVPCFSARVTNVPHFTYSPLISKFNDDAGSVAAGRRVFPDGEYTILDSWITLIGNLYRFQSGGARLKIQTNKFDTVKASLYLNEKNDVSYNVPHYDPCFEESGLFTHLLELQIPYYGQFKARTLSQTPQFPVPQANIQFSGDLGSEEHPRTVYEAGADDLDMWFLTGPPMVHPIVPRNPPIMFD